MIAYDVRGQGRAGATPPTRSLDHVAADVAYLLDRLGITEADVYGDFYRGAISQQFALNNPHWVRSLALIATAAKSPFEELDARAVNAEQHGMEAQVAKSLMRWFLPETIAIEPWEWATPEAERAARVEDWAAAWRAMTRLDLTDRACAFGKPVLARSGKQDLSATPDVMASCAEPYPEGRLQSINAGTNMMPMKQAEPVAAALIAFRERVQACSA